MKQGEENDAICIPKVQERKGRNNFHKRAGRNKCHRRDKTIEGRKEQQKVEKWELPSIIKEKDDIFSFLMKGFGDILPTDDDITSPLSTVYCCRKGPF